MGDLAQTDFTFNSNILPVISGDLGISVNLGSSVVLTTTDFQAVDPDNTVSQLTFTVSDQTYGHVAFASAPGTTISSFTEADLETGNVLFVQDGTATSPATFKVSVSDGIATSAAATILAAVPTATIQVLTFNGFDFANDNWLAAMGSGQIQPVTSPATEITIANSAQNMQFVIDGTNLTVDNEITPTDITAGTITAIHVLTNDATPKRSSTLPAFWMRRSGTMRSWRRRVEMMFRSMP